MNLVIAEKKDIATAISAALPGTPRESGLVIQQGDYTLTWLFGHVLELKAPEDYNENYKRWSIDQLPINFDNWDTKPKEDGGARQRFENVQRLLKQADTVIHAGDPDQEGQLLVDEVLLKCNYQGKVLRLNTSDNTTAGLKKALQRMDDNTNHLSSGRSAYARSVADFMVGINMSRLFSCLNPEFTLTVGRVQTPTLGLVVSRDAQIDGHKKIVYYTISVPVNIPEASGEIIARYEPNPSASFLVDGRILSRDAATDIVKNLTGKDFSNGVVAHKDAKTKPPLPFNFVKLQSYCSKHFGMDSDKVMDVSEALRMKYQAITYNRSDCQYLTKNQLDEAPDTMATVIKNISYKPKALDMSIRSDCFNDKYVVNHSAIIPTNNSVDISKMTQDERDMYLAICKFYMAQFMPPISKAVTKLTIDLNDGGKLTSTSTKITDRGYLEIFKDDGDDQEEEDKDEEETPLSSLANGKYAGQLGKPTIAERETRPPARYTEASLAEDMTCISKYVQDPRIKQILLDKDKDSKQDNGSIGTVATRGAIIKGLIKKGFLEIKGKNIVSTSLGRELFRILPDEIKGVDITAEWWLVCEAIVAGRATPEELQNDVLQTIQHIIDNRDTYPKVDGVLAAKFKRSGLNQIGICPRCGNPVVTGKQGYGCSAWREGCKFVIWREPKSPMMKNIKITPEDAEKLLNGEKIRKDKLVSPKTGSEFAALLSLEDNASSEFAGANLKITFDEGADAKPVGVCPRCGGQVVERAKGFGCSNWKAGCKFVIWKTPKGDMFKNVTIRASQAKALLEGKSIVLKKLVSKAGKEFDANATLDDSEKSDFGPSLKLSFDDLPVTVIGTCPRCGGEIREGKTGYGCSNWKEGCKFVIWKKPKADIFKNVTISAEQAKTLLEGKSVLMNRLINKSDKEFKAMVSLDDSEKSEHGPRLNISFEDIPVVSIGKCPRCGGDITEGKTGFGCSNWKNGCKFVIWKKPKQAMFRDETIDARDVKQLLAGKAVEFTRLYSPKSDKNFSAMLTLNDSEKSDFGPKFDMSFEEKADSKHSGGGHSTPARQAPQRGNPQRGAVQRSNPSRASQKR